MKRSTNIFDTVNSFHHALMQDEHHRLWSWEHCYKFFQSSPNDIDLAALNLGFYLASWGMYRGSSFLLQSDYKVHKPVVVEVLKPDYASLWNIPIENFSGDSGVENINLIFKLIKKIKVIYEPHVAKTKNVSVTDTLATKILLGTIGCIPAYDRFFVTGLRDQGLSYSGLKEKNVHQLVKWCLLHQSDLLTAQEKLSPNFQYPIMKIVDVYFWAKGSEVLSQKHTKKED
jgi:hypothetical protein